MITCTRNTKESDIRVSLDLRGSSQVKVKTDLPFFTHMLEQLGFHAGWNLDLDATADDAHHLIEDTALVLGEAIQKAWRALASMRRYGQCLLPMDESLILCAVDLCGRPFCVTSLELTHERVSGMETEMVPHFFRSLAMTAAITLHIRQLDGSNHHHIVEASFKALARALRHACEPLDREASTKGQLK